MAKRTGEGWLECRIFFIKFADEQSPRAKELEALSWIPLLESEAAHLFGNHHWHRDGFRLRLVTVEKAAAIHAKNEPHLLCRAEFGESLDDEWLIVWLLFELSKLHPELMITVEDEDGQFLLIEAALVLPRWLKPENSDYRVWIKGGRLHIIPRPSANQPTLPTKLDLPGALSVLRCGVPTRADDKIEKAVRDRLSGMPNIELDVLHHATCLLPVSAARLFYIDPSLVGAAVQSFYTRDIDGMKAASKMERFNPRKSASVSMRICFTRLQYAQLARQSFPPPPAWTLPQRSSPQFSAADLGMKLTVGLEMLSLISKPDLLDELAPVPSPALPVASADAEWPDYLRYVRARSSALTDEEIASAFLRITRSSIYRDTSKKSWCFKLRTAEAVGDLGAPFAAALATTLPDDSLAWLNVTADMVEDILARTEREMKAAEASGAAARPPPTAEQMANQVKSFVDAYSGLEGVEPPKRPAASFVPAAAAAGASSASPRASLAAAGDDSVLGKNAEVSFNPAKFLKALRSAVEHDGMQELDGSSEDEDEFGDDEKDEDNDEDKLDSEEEAELSAYMEEMDRQLKGTAMEDTFERQQEPKAKEKPSATESKGARATEKKEQDKEMEKDDGNLPPVDMDLNLVKNLLDSIAGQHGLPGPASALLASLSQQQPKQTKP